MHEVITINFILYGGFLAKFFGCNSGVVCAQAPYNIEHPKIICCLYEESMFI